MEVDAKAPVVRPVLAWDSGALFLCGHSLRERRGAGVPEGRMGSWFKVRTPQLGGFLCEDAAVFLFL